MNNKNNNKKKNTVEVQSKEWVNVNREYYFTSYK